MDDVVAELAGFPQRGPASDAERRAARALALRLRRAGRPQTRVRTVWVRTAWAGAHSALAGLAVVGSILSIVAPVAGLAVAAAALVLLIADLSGRRWLGGGLVRALGGRRATQNVVSPDPRGAGHARVRLVITAATDSPRQAAMDAGAVGRLRAAAQRRAGGHLPGPHGVLVLAMAALVACCVVRLLSTDPGRVLGLVQLLPTATLLVLTVAFAEAAGAAPAVRDDASARAVAAVLAITAALDRRPPRNLSTDVLLAGAGSAHAAGLRDWLEDARRAGARAQDVAVLEVLPLRGGRPAFRTRDGLVMPLALHPRLVALAKAQTRPPGRAVVGRQMSGARAARAAGWPALAIGDDGDGADDQTVVSFALAVVAALDAELS